MSAPDAHPWSGQEHARLRDLIEARQVALGVHIRRMNAPGSQVYSYGENLVPAALILGAAFGAALLHRYLGAAVLAAGCLWWALRVRPRIRDNVFRRTRDLVLGDPVQFDLLWSRGLITLYAKMPDGSERLARRRDDWRAYVRSFHQDMN